MVPSHRTASESCVEDVHWLVPLLADSFLFSHCPCVCALASPLKQFSDYLTGSLLDDWVHNNLSHDRCVCLQVKTSDTDLKMQDFSFFDFPSIFLHTETVVLFSRFVLYRVFMSRKQVARSLPIKQMRQAIKKHLLTPRQLARGRQCHKCVCVNTPQRGCAVRPGCCT